MCTGVGIADTGGLAGSASDFAVPPNTGEMAARNDDARIPLFGRRTVLEHLLRLEKETERSDWTNSLPLKLV